MLIVFIFLFSGFGLYMLLKPPSGLNHNELNNHIFQDQKLSTAKIDRIAEYEKAHISRKNDSFLDINEN